MTEIIKSLFSEAQKQISPLDCMIDISNTRFTFYANFSEADYFTSRLTITQFPDAERDFRKMPLIEKMKCPEFEFLCFEEARLESEPLYIKKEIARHIGLSNVIWADYLYIKSITLNTSKTTTPSLMATEQGSVISNFYLQLLRFFEGSYAQMQSTFSMLEGFPAWDQDLTGNYRKVIENNIRILNKIVLLENNLSLSGVESDFNPLSLAMCNVIL